MESGQFPELTRTLEKWGQIIEAKLRDKLNNDQSNASYELNRSLRYEVRIDERVYELGINMADYWKYVNSGRKTGKMPPLKNIEDWIRIKPIIPFRDYKGRIPTTRQLAYLIARKIGDKGTKGTEFFNLTIDEIWKEMESDVRGAIERDIQTDTDKALKYLSTITRR